MVNVTLSIEESAYMQMRKHSEIKWSGFVRKAIKKQLEELETLEKSQEKEGKLAMLASEETLKKGWDNKADKRRKDV